ncbi:hypothetical protein LTR84_002953 [Exophiala bonariae]|uniref:Uncharacterized protein n=1 Tax=Exophiala bonariae TaxID=1690606 RepID=A0AAV9N9D3_9EURO|nr:hypothetical protein LTR84_002953 [Exophiala bonariae]
MSGNDKGYNVTSSGTNSQGNHYCSRDYGSSATNSNAYHYSNTFVMPQKAAFSLITTSEDPSTDLLSCPLRNGSYYYSNPNGSTYYNNGSGGSSSTAPSGGNSGKK